MKLYGHPYSNAARRVQMLCEECGIPYTYQLVDLMKGEQYATDVRHRFVTAMDEDLGTPEALGQFNVVADELRRRRNDVDPKPAIAEMRHLADVVLGIDLSAPPEAEKGALDDKTAQLLAVLLDVRKEAKAQKNWALADIIRNRLTELDIRIVDQKDGTTTWEVVPRVPA